MQSQPIRIIDEMFSLQAEISDYESLTFTRCYDTFGSFEIRINQYKNNVEHLKKGAIIFLSPEKAGIIQYRETALDSGGKKSQILTIKGYTLEHILSYRITAVPSGKTAYEATGKAEDVIKNLISYNLGQASLNASRKIAEIYITPSVGRGKQIAVASSYVSLSEECQKLLAQAEMGLSIKLDYSSKKFTLDVYIGKNLTTAQNINPPVIFSEEFDNIASRSLVDSLLEFKNTAVVSGQVKGSDATVETVNNQNVGLARREVFIDAGLMETDSFVSLADRGREGLVNYSPIYTLEGTVMPTASFYYGTDYTLGDLVTVRFRDGEKTSSMDTRIVQVTENYDNSGKNIEIVFGTKIPTVADKLKLIAQGKKQ